jgi:hypothetical protein
MMWTMAMIGRWCLTLATLAVCAGGAAAQQASPASQSGLPLDLTPPADTGKPRAFAPSLDTAPAPGCEAVLDCRLRVIGAVRHDGAVELNATLFKW